MIGTSKTGIAALFLLVLSSANLAAQGLPVETGSHVPVALWFVGAVVLAVAIIYGIMRNKRRTLAERQTTEQATRARYAAEERDRVDSKAV